MDRKFRFTKERLNNLPLPESSQVRYYDTDTPGLIVRITPKGKKTFTLYRRVQGSKPISYTIGEFPQTTIFNARKQAQVLNGKLSQGVDIRVEKRNKKAQQLTLRQAIAEYLLARELKESTLADYQRSLKWGTSGWMDFPLAEITVPMIEKRHQELGQKSKARANNTMRVLRAVYNYAQAKYRHMDGSPILIANPVEFLSKTRQWYRVPRKTQLLKPHDIKPWIQTVTNLNSSRYPELAHTVRDYFLFQLFTGLRPTEGATLLWKDVDLMENTFTIHDTKNHLSPEFPLTSYTQALLTNRKKESESKFVFHSQDTNLPLNDVRAWVNHVRKDSGLPFNPHDLRRTFLTVAESLEINPITIKRLANHKTIEHDVTTGYIVRDIDRLRQPAQRITDYLLDISK